MSAERAAVFMDRKVMLPTEAKQHTIGKRIRRSSTQRNAGPRQRLHRLGASTCFTLLLDGLDSIQLKQRNLPLGCILPLKPPVKLHEGRLLDMQEHTDRHRDLRFVRFR
jgi:hypothetical protein